MDTPGAAVKAEGLAAALGLKRFAPSGDRIGAVLAARRDETNRLPPQRPRLRDRQAFEHLRMQAGELLAAGHAQAEAARMLGVARQTSAAGGPTQAVGLDPRTPRSRDHAVQGDPILPIATATLTAQTPSTTDD
jgi:hypothetical protein